MDDKIKAADDIANTGYDEKQVYDVSSSSRSSDIEKGQHDGSIRPGTTLQLQRKLQSRHLQMIAIGGTIGTGLFIGSGAALATAGPAGSLIAYAFVGTITYSVMVALGEMATYIPISGAFTVYAARFVDRSLGFAMGWIYFLCWAITYALELTACGLIIQYWAPELNVGIFIGVFWLVITSLNCLPVSFYGEAEFWFSSIKVLTVVGFLIFAICIDAGAGQHGYLGFKTWDTAFVPYDSTWKNQSLAKFVSFWSVLIQAGFSYQGTELVAIAAGETDNPRKTVPAAIKKTFYRILFFFVFTIFFIGLLVPADNKQLLSSNTDASASPLVIAAKLAGVKALPGVINAVLLTVVLSAANSNVYSAARILIGLAEAQSAPSYVKYTTARGVPLVAVAFTAAFGLLAFMNESTHGAEVFEWFINITAIAAFIAWACINLCHIAFMKALQARGQSRDTLPYKAPWQPWFSWYGLFFNCLIIITNGFTAFIPWNVSDFFVAYISLILFIILYIGHKVVCRTQFVSAADADLDSGRKEVDDMHFEEVKPTNLWARFWAWLG